MKGNGGEVSQPALYRISAVVLLVGAVLVTAGNLLGPQGGAREAVASGMYYPAAVVVLLGGLLVMAGLPAVYLRQRAESGVLGLVGHRGCVRGGDAPARRLPSDPGSDLPLDRNHERLKQGPQHWARFLHHLLRSRKCHRLARWSALRSRHYPGQDFLPPARRWLHSTHGGQLRARLSEYSRGWRYQNVLVVGNHRDLWCGRLYGGPVLVRNRASTERRRASANSLKPFYYRSR